MTRFSLDRATYGVGESALDDMLLGKLEFPDQFHAHQVVREGPLNNDTLAQNGFEGTTAERFRLAGRVTGMMRELAWSNRRNF